MDKIKHSIVVIPAYEPSDNLIDIAQQISDRGYRLIVSDDGSGDEYEHIWEALRKITRVRVIHQDVNSGKGAALKAAFKYIQTYGSGIEYILTMDADGQHLVSDMENVLRASWKAPECLILGSRRFDRGVPIRSRLGNRITRTVFSLTCRSSVKDTQTGLRAFGSGLVENGETAVSEGEEVSKSMSSNPRTAIGWISDTHYVMLVSDGRTSESEGLSLYELAEFMESLGCETAYSLDGGGSSTMYYQGEVVNNPTTGGDRIEERSVSDIVYVGE